MLCVYTDLSAAQRPNIDKDLSFPLHGFKLFFGLGDIFCCHLEGEGDPKKNLDIFSLGGGGNKLQWKFSFKFSPLS